MAELYEGIKFKHIRIGASIPHIKQLESLKYWCDIFAEKNYAPPYPGGSSGNLSFRLKANKPDFIITASHTALCSEMPDSDFCIVHDSNPDTETVTFSGIRTPSSESMLHAAIYKARPKINAVFHGHSQMLLKIAPQLEIPTTQKEVPYGTKEVVEIVMEILGRHDFIIIKNHGFISLGTTLEEAGKRTYLIHQKAKELLK